MNIVQLIALLAKIAGNEDLREAITKFVEFIKSLTEDQRTAYLSKFASVGGYGCPCNPDCPDCPDDCKVVEAELLASLEG